ncbi:MAG: type II toxin-antitoxin system RelE/ParE family toxin [Balneolaceae bacterium]
MSSKQYRISKQAIVDLNDIWTYTSHKWSKEQADSYYNLIITEFDFIVDNFMTGKSAEQTRQNYRVVKVKSHLIYYRRSSDNIVEIVRVLHEKLDISTRLQ